MSQQRTTLVFPAVPGSQRPSRRAKSYSHFLNLPFAIRRKIYLEAGLVLDKTIHMNFWAKRRSIKETRYSFDHDDDSHLPPLPLSLLAVCRFLNEELGRLFYGENRFAITRSVPRGMQDLLRFSDATFAHFRVLLLRANLVTCGAVCCSNKKHGWCGNKYTGCVDSSRHDPHLSQKLESYPNFISQWTQVCERLSNAEPGKLALYVICDCKDRQTAEAVVEPLLKLPLLRDCGIRLAEEYDRGIQGVAKDAALHLTGRSPPPPVSPFRFLHLPKEIQLDILSYTSLISDYEITCAYDVLYYDGQCSARGSAAPETTSNTRLLRCFCCRAHSAFNFQCRGCDGLGFPHALFLVSREFREAAIEIFYERNSFATCMTNRVPPGLETPNLRGLQGSILPGFTYFPQYSVRFLTSLKLDFEYFSHYVLQSRQPGWHYWLDTVHLLEEEAYLPALNLEIRFKEKLYHGLWEMPIRVDKGYFDRMCDTYDTIIQPVTALQGLNNFFVHMNWDSSYGEPKRGVPDGRLMIEQRLERMIMGQDYDALKHGKGVQMLISGMYF